MIKLGLDRFVEPSDSLGLITNATGVDSNLEYNFNRLRNIKAIFTPEQGIYGNMMDGESINDSRLGEIPVYSLYGEKKQPSEEQLEDINVLIYDIQDAGVRYYTYISTLKLSLESAKKYNKKIIVLDRPNPLGADHIYGPVLKEGYFSFVGIDELPIKYGMTPGEIASFFNRKIGADLEIIKMEGYRRSMRHNEALNFYIPLSLHLPTFESVINYQAMCLLEATNISVGRGTTSPFMQFGAPGLKTVEGIHPGIKLRTVRFRPTYSLYAGMEIDGFYIHILNMEEYDPFRLVLDVMRSYDKLEIDDAKMRRLLGDDTIFGYIEESIDYEELMQKWDKDLEKFQKLREKFLIYS